MTAPLLITALDEILAQGELLLRGLSDEAYTQKVPQAYNASIGAHYRHSVEHLQTVLYGLDEGEIDYDLRPRNIELETDRLHALTITQALRRETAAISASTLERVIRVRSKASYAQTESAQCTTNIGREILFVVSHAIHHYSLIGLMCSLQNIPVPVGFGVAPSTLKHREQQGTGGA